MDCVEWLHGVQTPLGLKLRNLVILDFHGFPLNRLISLQQHLAGCLACSRDMPAGWVAGRGLHLPVLLRAGVERFRSEVTILVNRFVNSGLASVTLALLIVDLSVSPQDTVRFGVGSLSSPSAFICST